MRFRLMIGLSLVTSTVVAIAQMPDKPITRPRITGISHIAVYASDMAATDKYYREVVGCARVADPEDAKGVDYLVNATQYIEVLPLPADAGINRLDHVAFKTDNAEGLRRYLSVKSWKTPGSVSKGADGSRWFAVKDPEGNTVEFVQPPENAKAPEEPNVIGHHIIHVGFLVHNRANEDTFYRDLLGFRPYWYGGMQDDKIDWVSQQTPNSHDWLEYMLTSGPSGTGIPANMTQRTLGVLDHVSIGEPSVDAAFKELASANRLSGRHDDAPKIGKDGKGQLNLYDPDGTRIELMNFHATEKPCCSAFTAEDPAE
jgi:catechol 2,3-dioxygenase-like lactoylglutathione lyase family enzyme